MDYLARIGYAIVPRVRLSDATRQIPRPAGENAGLRDDATLENSDRTNPEYVRKLTARKMKCMIG
jgi:hypothetical protein